MTETTVTETTKTETKHALNWFEIPVVNMDRAVSCYEKLLGESLRREVFGGMPYAIFPMTTGAVGGALVHDKKRSPGASTIVYLNADGRLDEILARVAGSGAKLLLPKTPIGKDGAIAIVEDSEGNAVGFNTAF